MISKTKVFISLLLLCTVLSCISDKKIPAYNHSKPIYTHHSFLGPIKNVLLYNYPVKYDSINYYFQGGNGRKQNTYFYEWYLPLEGIFPSNRVNYYRYSKKGLLSYSGHLPKEIRKTIHNYSNIGEIIDVSIALGYNKQRNGGRKYVYDLKDLSELEKNYGSGQYMPAFFKVCNLVAPNQIPISFTWQSSNFYTPGDTVLRWKVPVYNRTKKDTIIMNESFNEPTLLYHKHIADPKNKRIDYRYLSKGWVHTIGDNLKEDFFQNLTMEIDSSSYENRFSSLESVFTTDSVYKLNTRLKIDYGYNDKGLLIRKTYQPIFDPQRKSGYLLDGSGAFGATEGGFRGGGWQERVYTYDEQNRLKTQSYNFKDPWRYRNTFYYSGKKTIPDSVLVFQQYSSTRGPGGNVYMLKLDKEGKVIEIDYLMYKIEPDESGVKAPKFYGSSQKRFYKYKDYDKHGNWTKVDIYVWLSPRILKALNGKPKEYYEFWSQKRFVGSQERVLEYYE